jgi:signal transduction histidine kinase
MTPGTYVQIQLVDTATSIDDDTLPHVFEPYAAILDGQRGDLSLATAQGIIRQSGGSIAVERAPDQGNVWTILLPESSERSQELRASA